MLKWIAIGILAITVVFSTGLMIAAAYGTAQNQTVLTITISQDGFDGPQKYQLYELESRIRVALRFPVDNLLYAQNWWENPQEFVLITQSEVVNPHEQDIVQRTRQYGVYNYDLSSGTKTPLLEYTRGGRPSLTMLRLYNDLQPFFSISGQTAGFYDSALNKLFVYDRRDRYSHLHTATFDLHNGTNRLAWSPDGLTVAARYSPGVLMVMHVLAGKINLYDVTSREDFLPEWSSDGRYVLISDPSEQALKPLAVLDVSAGQWMTEVAGVVGRSAHWLCKGEWISYETYSAQSAEEFSHILHLHTGRSFHLGQHPQLMDYEINRLWSPDCEHLILTAGADSTSASRPTAIFVSDFSLQDVRLLHQQVYRNSVQVSGGTITYAVQDANNIITIYREPLDGSAPAAELRSVQRTVPAFFGYLDNYDKGLYLDYNGQTPSGLYLVDFENGSSRLISIPGDRVSNATLFYQD